MPLQKTRVCWTGLKCQLPANPGVVGRETAGPSSRYSLCCVIGWRCQRGLAGQLGKVLRPTDSCQSTLCPDLAHLLRQGRALGAPLTHLSTHTPGELLGLFLRQGFTPYLRLALNLKKSLCFDLCWPTASCLANKTSLCMSFCLCLSVCACLSLWLPLSWTLCTFFFKAEFVTEPRDH